MIEARAIEARAIVPVQLHVEWAWLVHPESNGEQFSEVSAQHSQETSAFQKVGPSRKDEALSPEPEQNGEQCVVARHVDGAA